ncbi:MAG: cardiolipin synthase [Defluviitaleaceae bacterium]|nr:cardiolipin synthase [Defluviitaleaceae bacterium]MCL2835445.1 cardiolipin synthase [Defluviitaleaceae bacterium]
MKISKSLITRAVITLGLIAVQIFLFARFLGRFVNFVPIISAASYVISILIILLLVKKRESCVYKMTWIIVILALPISGGILYLLFGNGHLLKRTKGRLKKEQDITAKHLQNSGNGQVNDVRIASLINYVKDVSSYPAYENTESKYYPYGDLMFDDMLTELSNAKEFIYMQYFIINEGRMWDRITEILIAKAEEGLDVRLIFDDLGSYALFSKSYFSYLRSKNIKVLRFNPIRPLLSLFMNHRDHRKITVVDGRAAFTGGINMVDRSINMDSRFKNFKDTAIRLGGEAVWSFTLMFIETWNTVCKVDERINDYEALNKTWNGAPGNDGLVLPYSDSPLNDERLGENIYIDILNQSKRYVYIFTPYLIAGEKMVYALQMAAKRGVDIKIAVPSVDKNILTHRLTRSYYKILQKAGVRFFEYTAGFIHAKSFVCDDEIAVVGTINLDYRSLYLHFECAALLYKTSSVKDIRDDAAATFAGSREVLPGGKKRAFWGELVDAILNLFAPLL